MSLGSANIRKQFKNREPFWGKYEELNLVTIPSSADIQAFQLKKIEEFQKAALSSQKNGKITELNELFKSGSINSKPSKYNQDEDVKIDKVITELMTSLNAGYSARSGSIKNGTMKYNYDSLQQKLRWTATVLENISKECGGINSFVYQEHLDELYNAIKACELQGLNDAAIDTWYAHLNSFKGDVVEEIGTAWLNEVCPDITSITTGAIELQGTTREGRHNGQIIQDLLSLSISDIDLESIPISYRMFGDTSMRTTTIKEFIANLERASQSHHHIVLDDEGYDVLLGLSGLNMQAKAGINQTPWNQNKSTSISIGEMTDETNGLALGINRTFQLLHSLDQEEPSVGEGWVNTTGSNYNALANYGLATTLAKILHLSDKEGNQYLLTPDGFTTYTDRIAHLFEKTKKVAHIVGQVSVNDSTMENSYGVTIT